jgi:hypothetical protein
MSLDRRQFVTGLTAVAATGIAPALAAPPIPLLVRSGHSYRWRSYQPRELIAATFTTAMCSPWHVDMRGEDDVTYLHVPSGFYFAVYPDATNDIWQVCAAATLPLPFYDSQRKLIGRAVVFAHFNSIALARARRGRDGSFFVDYQDPRYNELVCEDAPPLPTVEPYADGVSRVEQFCQIPPSAAWRTTHDDA